MSRADTFHDWLPLPYEAWRPTCTTLHLWLQIIGKLALAQSAWVNHSWHVTLQVTARGIGTRLLRHGAKSFQVDFDFIAHSLVIRVVDGGTARLALRPQATATFYRNVMSSLDALNIPVTIGTTPCELPDVIPFDEDFVHASYDRDYVNRYWRVLARVQGVLERFRARFIGKCSPVHFFWGSADLAVTRFSGRTAPPHPGGVPHLPDWVAREAYSHEVSSAGFWAGGDRYPQAIFYSYAYPEPAGFAGTRVSPDAAHYESALKEFVLPYEDVRTAASAEAAILDFLQSTYEAAANGAHWDRASLERSVGLPPPSDGNP